MARLCPWLHMGASFSKLFILRRLIVSLRVKHLSTGQSARIQHRDTITCRPHPAFSSVRGFVAGKRMWPDDKDRQAILNSCRVELTLKHQRVSGDACDGSRVRNCMSCLGWGAITLCVLVLRLVNSLGASKQERWARFVNGPQTGVGGVSPNHSDWGDWFRDPTRPIQDGHPGAGQQAKGISFPLLQSQGH